MNIIPLGGNCSVTYHLQLYNLRNESYPFDWVKMSIRQLINILKNNFDEYENIHIKKYSENHQSFILTNKYHVQFAHEVMNDDSITFKSKLIKRIEKFKKLNDPIFIRIELKDENQSIYEILINELNKYFTNYRIILISKTCVIHSKIEWYELNSYHNDWTCPQFDWSQILDKLKS